MWHAFWGIHNDSGFERKVKRKGNVSTIKENYIIQENSKKLKEKGKKTMSVWIKSK